MKLQPAILIPLLAWGLTGCAWPPRSPAQVAFRSIISDVATPGALADDGLYLDAKSAIGRRDYATALDSLQAANARSPNDVRVINAFGVVYDKLGRFDLSQRYYAQAAKLDPQSSIVANNQQYSGYLSTQKTPGAPAAAAVVLALAQATPAPASDTREALYGQAVAAISRDDDARALVLLNSAPGHESGDVRVLNALGVVYSRLGRYDQGEHYYALAAALDPGSAIVANNRDATRRLRACCTAIDHAHTLRPPPAMVVAAALSTYKPPLAPQ